MYDSNKKNKKRNKTKGKCIIIVVCISSSYPSKHCKHIAEMQYYGNAENVSKIQRHMLHVWNVTPLFPYFNRFRCSAHVKHVSGDFQNISEFFSEVFSQCVHNNLKMRKNEKTFYRVSKFWTYKFFIYFILILFDTASWLFYSFPTFFLTTCWPRTLL